MYFFKSKYSLHNLWVFFIRKNAKTKLAILHAIDKRKMNIKVLPGELPQKGPNT